MKASFKSIATTFKKLFAKRVKPITAAEIYEQKEEKKERIATGRSNGILSVYDRNSKAQKENKVSRRRKLNKIGNKSRKHNFKKAS